MAGWIRLVALLMAAWVASAAVAQRSTPVELLDSAGNAFAGFGYNVAIDGDTLICGAPYQGLGAAFVYRWTGSTWALEAKLEGAPLSSEGAFGYRVAISGDTAVVTSNADTVDGHIHQGSAFVFTRTGTTWTQQARLISSDGAAEDEFGSSVAISGDTIVVGADQVELPGFINPGAAYVFTRSGTTWTEQAKLVPGTPVTGGFFGYSVALSGDTAVVGSWSATVGGNFAQGCAYVFTRSGNVWNQQTQLLASDGTVGDRFGSSVALSGTTIVVGAPYDDTGANTNQGSAYVFTLSGGLWIEQAKLVASDGQASGFFGYSVSLSGETALVGTSFSALCSAYTFVRSGTAWMQQVKLTSPDATPNDWFGTSVALCGDTAVVGAPNDTVGANSLQGSAWVFSRVGSSWIGADQQLVASDGAAGDFDGFSVAISGDTAIVGAFNDTVTSSQQGSAYIYVRSGMNWIQQAQLTASDSALGDFFGTSVAIFGDTAIVGANGDDVGANNNQGSAYIFVRTGTTWTQQAKLTASDGAGSDFFGYAVAISGDTAIVGAYGDDISANTDRGSAYIFVRSGTTWTQQAKLTASDGAANDQFGYSVALDGNSAIVGAYSDDVGANTDQGSAYVFVRSGTTWSQQAKLTASDGAASDQFGYSVAISGNTVLAGASADTVGSNSGQGSAYCFTRSGSTWTQQAKLTASDGAASDGFGGSVALSGDTAMIGAPLDNQGINADQGSVYVFARVSSVWTQRGQLIAPDGAGSDRLGISVALSGSNVVAGAYLDDVGANTNQGSAWVFSVVIQDLTFAQNVVTGVGYPTLGAAMSPALSGHQITATEAAWRMAASLDTAGRNLILRSGADIRTPSTTALVLGGSSALITPAGSVAEIFGPLSVTGNQAASISSDSFHLGSRGSLRLFANARLDFFGGTAQIDGPVQLDAGSRLVFTASTVLNADLTALDPAEITSTGGLTNRASCSLTNAFVNSALFSNFASMSSQGSSTFLGSYLNAATTTVQGELVVLSSFTNDGTIVGEACANCLSTPPTLDVGGNLTLGAAASLSMPVAGSLVRLGENFDSALNNNSRYDLRDATLQFENAFASLVEQTVEVMSMDIGPNASGLDRTIPGHYPVGTLRIGPVASLVRLVDNHDNDGLGQGSCEAIYVDTLWIESDSRLINTSCRIYYNTLINDGIIDVPSNVIPLAAPCPSDLNGDTLVDDSDFVIFAASYDLLDCADPIMPVGCPADLNGDDAVDDADFVIFASAYDALLCP